MLKLPLYPGRPIFTKCLYSTRGLSCKKGTITFVPKLTSTQFDKENNQQTVAQSKSLKAKVAQQAVSTAESQTTI